MGDNFMNVMTKIEDIIAKEKELKSRVGSYIADALHTRIFSNGIERNGTATERDIRNAIKDFSDAEKVEILIKALISLSIKFDSNDSSEKSAKKNKRRSMDW